jgi:hypothetical protein
MLLLKKSKNMEDKTKPKNDNPTVIGTTPNLAAVNEFLAEFAFEKLGKWIGTTINNGQTLFIVAWLGDPEILKLKKNKINWN